MLAKFNQQNEISESVSKHQIHSVLGLWRNTISSIEAFIVYTGVVCIRLITHVGPVER